MSAAAQARSKPDAAPVPRKPASASDAGVYQQAADLARRMGSTKGFDPMPPDQYLTFMHPSYPPVWRVWAWALSKTIRYGHRSPWCVDKGGRALTLQDAARDLEMDEGNVRAKWRQLEEEGRTAREGPHLLVCGQVTLRPIGEEKENKKVCTNLPPYILKQIWGMPQERQARFWAEWEAEGTAEQAALTESAAAVRFIFEHRKDTIFAAYGVKKIREGPQSKTLRTTEPAFLCVLQPVVPQFVQTFTQGGLYNGEERAKRASVQTRASLLTKEKKRPRVSSSSDVPTVTEQAETTTTNGGSTARPQQEVSTGDLNDFGDRLRALFVAAGKPAPTDGQIGHLLELLAPEERQAYLDDLAPRVSRLRHPGALHADVAAFVAAAPARKAALDKADAAAEAERRRCDQLAAQQAREDRLRDPYKEYKTACVDRLVAELGPEGWRAEVSQARVRLRREVPQWDALPKDERERLLRRCARDAVADRNPKVATFDQFLAQHPEL